MTRVALLVILLLAATGCRPSSATTNAPKSEGPPWFEDVTAKSGLNAFVHDAGPITPAFFLPQSFGSGVAVIDFDGDGRLDVYLVHNGGPTGKKNQLFHQEPDGTFRDVSAGSGLDVAGFGLGVAVGDVNNDGRPDVLVTEFGATRLFLNLGGGKFREVTREAGLDNPLLATSAAFFDYDRDGHLDLIVVNYVDLDPSIKCGGDYCGPNVYKGTVPRLYRNLGPQRDGGVKFEDVTIRAGLGALPGKGLGVLCADFTGDRWPDIFIANDLLANYLWVNQKDGTFKEEALPRGLAFTATANPAANMGVAWADVDGNGLPDLFVTHLRLETHTLWTQEPRGFFQDRTVAAGLTAGERRTGFGCALVDFDRDGWPDLAFVNGGVIRNPGAKPDPAFWPAYAERHQLFRNSGGGKFQEISDTSPALCGTPGVGRGLAVGDFDNDGAPDLLITEAGGPPKLLRNVAPAAGHWLTVRALIPKLKRDAYGAEVTVSAGGKSYWRLIQPGYSYLSSNDVRAHFGLGPAANYDSIRVIWPDGLEESFPGGPADRQVELRQGEGRPAK
ncbi:MAG: CRTAC1 family protein [Gemmataceae bacterium]